MMSCMFSLQVFEKSDLEVLDFWKCSELVILDWFSTWRIKHARIPVRTNFHWNLNRLYLLIAYRVTIANLIYIKYCKQQVNSILCSTQELVFLVEELICFLRGLDTWYNSTRLIRFKNSLDHFFEYTLERSSWTLQKLARCHFLKSFEPNGIEIAL